MSPSPPGNRLGLACGDLGLVACPGIGGAIARFTWRGIDILRPASDAAIAGGEVRQMACYPLVPYSNRIGHARLLFRNEVHALRPNFPPEIHSIHGVGWQRAWEVTGSTASGLDLRLAHAPDADWPFAFEAQQSFQLDEDGLEVRLRLANRTDRAMPAGLGLHPFFPVAAGTRLEASWTGCWAMDGDKLPSEHGPVSSGADYRESRPVDGWTVDHCFTGWNRRARLDYLTHHVEILASNVLGHIVCYSPGNREFIALEPVSHANNAFTLAARGRPDTGMRTLEPGAILEASLRLVVKPQPAP